MNMGYPKVIYIGGTPMVGKSTVARLIASRLQYGCISTDDLGAAIAAVTKATTHPEFHYMGEQDYRDYYAANSAEKLIRDIDDQHQALWPALQTLFQNHSSWGTPIIIEGWALRPDYVSELGGDIAGLFLLAEDALIENRVRSSRFSENANHREAMLQRYLERSVWYNSVIKGQISRLGLRAIQVSEDMQPNKIYDQCMRVLNKDQP